MIQNNLPFNVSLRQVIGPKIQSFCKGKPREAVFVDKDLLMCTDRDIQFQVNC